MDAFRFLLATKQGSSLRVETYVALGIGVQGAVRALPEMPEAPYRLYGQKLTNHLLVIPQMQLTKLVTAEALCTHLKEEGDQPFPYHLIKAFGDLPVPITGIKEVDKLPEPPNKEMIQIHQVTSWSLDDYTLDLSEHLSLYNMRFGLMRAKHGAEPLWVDGRECDVIYTKVTKSDAPDHTDMLINLLGTEHSSCVEMANRLIAELKDSPFGPHITDHKILRSIDGKKIDAHVIRTSLDFQFAFELNILRRGR